MAKKKAAKKISVGTKKPAGTKAIEHHVFEGCPTFFRAWCSSVRNRNFRGGYKEVGRQFTGAMGELNPYTLSLDEWFEELEKLEALFRKAAAGTGLNDAVVWCRRTFPKIMAEIPTGSHSKFVEGIWERWREMGKRFEF